MGVGVFLGGQNLKCQVLAKFQLSWGGLLKNMVFLGKWSKNSGSLAYSCIADSLMSAPPPRLSGQRFETQYHEWKFHLHYGPFTPAIFSTIL